jgi:hypothetical protein
VLKLVRRLALPAFMLLAAGHVAAQDLTLSDVWFKVKIKVKGYSAVPEAKGEKPQKTTLTQTAYLHLNVGVPKAAPGDGAPPPFPVQTLDFQLWTEVAPDVWEPTYEGTTDLEIGGGLIYFFADTNFLVDFPGPAGAESYMTVVFKAKLDKEGAFKSATVQSLGGEVYDGTTTGDDAVRGGISMSGKSIDPDKLPFELP